MTTEIVDIRPGDTLVFHYKDFLSDGQRDRLKEMMAKEFPDAGKIVILEGGITLSVARPGANELLAEIRDSVASIDKTLDSVAWGGVVSVSQGER